jgi:hypothetical protein
MSVFGYDASPYPQVLCGEMSGTKTTAIPTQKTARQAWPFLN